MGILDNILKIFVGDKSKKDIGQIQPLVEEIKKHEAALEKLSNDELRAKSDFFRKEIKEAQADIQKQINDLEKQSEKEQDINKKEEFYNQIRSEEHTSELQSRPHLVCRLLLEK